MTGGRQTPFFWLHVSIVSYPQFYLQKNSENRKLFISHSAANLAWCGTFCGLKKKKKLIWCNYVLLQKYCVWLCVGGPDSAGHYVISTFALPYFSKMWKLLNSETNRPQVFGKGLWACSRLTLHGLKVTDDHAVRKCEQKQSIFLNRVFADNVSWNNIISQCKCLCIFIVFLCLCYRNTWSLGFRSPGIYFPRVALICDHEKNHF